MQSLKDDKPCCREREVLGRSLRARPAGSEPLSIVDYLYLGQLPPLLFATEVWQDARHRFGGASDAKQHLNSALGQIVPIIRNEIAHVREVDRDRLLRANIACAELQMLHRARLALSANCRTCILRCWGAVAFM